MMPLMRQSAVAAISWPGSSTCCIWGKADIKCQANAADSVENEPEPT